MTKTRIALTYSIRTLFGLALVASLAMFAFYDVPSRDRSGDLTTILSGRAAPSVVEHRPRALASLAR